MENPNWLNQIANTLNQQVPASMNQRELELLQLLGERDQRLVELLEERDERLSDLLIEGEKQFGTVSKDRKKRKQRNETTQQNQAGLARGRGRGNGQGKFPPHPLLSDNAAQKYAGMNQADSPVAADHPELEDVLLEVIGEAIENNPELRLNPALTNDLVARIELYNQQKLQNNATPKLDVPR